MLKKLVQKELKYVMDASALLAVANNENHIVELPKLFNYSLITTFNLAEAANKIIIKYDADEELTWNYLGNFIQNHYPLDDNLSYEVIMLTKLSKPLGLSLGDRYCIALGKLLNLPIYTADKVWKQLY